MAAAQSLLFSSFLFRGGLYVHSCGIPEAYLNAQSEYTLLEARKDRNNFVISGADALPFLQMEKLFFVPWSGETHL